MAVPLKHCPFCGGTESVYPGYRYLRPGSWELEPKPYEIDCIGCGITFQPRKGMDVVAAWNRRAGSEAA